MLWRFLVGLAALAPFACVLDASGTGSGAAEGGAGGSSPLCDPPCDDPGECMVAHCSDAGTCVEEPAVEGTECGFDDFCDGEGRCLLRAGDACTDALDCVTGHCVDGVCCKGPCVGPCERCGDEGECSDVVSGEDPDAECPQGSCDGLGHCATGELSWVRRWGTAGVDYVSALATAPSGIVLAMPFQFSMTVGNKTFTTGGIDTLLVKLDAAGTPLWATQLGGAGEEYITELEVDDQGQIVATGFFSSQLVIETSMSDAGASADAFVAAFDPDGNLVSPPLVLGGAGNQRAYSLTLLPSGARVVAGSFNDSIDLGDTVLGSINPADEDGFVAAFDEAGMRLWHQAFAGGGTQRAVAVDAGATTRVWVGGYFDGGMALGAESFTSSGGHDGFVLALDGGEPTWIETFGTNTFQVVHGIAATGEGVVVTGAFDGDLVEGGPTSKGVLDVFLIGYSAEGLLERTQGFGSTGPDAPFGIAVNPGGNVVVAGVLDGAADLGGGPRPATFGDVFVLKQNAAGEHLWSRTFGGSLLDEGLAVAVSATGTFVAGSYQSADATVQATALPHDGGRDAFCVRLAP